MSSDGLWSQVADGEPRKVYLYPNTKPVGFWERLWCKLRRREPERPYFFGTASFRFTMDDDSDE